MASQSLDQQRAKNLWEAFIRKFPPLVKATRMEAPPKVDMGQVGGLEAAKEEVLTYACAVTDPEVYARWGTFPPAGLLLVGPASSGKTLLAEALAHQTGMPFLEIRVPRLVLQMLHAPQTIGELLEAWSAALTEMPATTIFFEELEFTQEDALGALRPDLPVGPAMEFLLEVVDRAIEHGSGVVLGSTSKPDALRPALLATGRFERVVEVKPTVPDDVVAALLIHAAAAEKRAGRELFRGVAWADVVKEHREASIGQWVRLLHAVLRRKARCETAEEETDAVVTQDLMREVERLKNVTDQLPPSSGRYL